MKRFLCLILSGLVLSSVFIFAQCDCLNPDPNLTTYPNSIYRFDHRVMFFNWEDDFYKYYDPSNGYFMDNLSNPFIKDQTNQETAFLRFINDYKNEDGWELLSVNLGYYKEYLGNDIITSAYFQNDRTISVILYNKYSSIIRVLIAIWDNDNSGYNSAKISLGYASGSLITNSIIQNKANEPNIALDKFWDTDDNGHIKDPILTAYTNLIYGADTYRWTFADFDVSYDPCSCFFSSKLKISIELLNSLSLGIDTKLNGTNYSDAINNSHLESGFGANTFSANVTDSVYSVTSTFSHINSFKNYYNVYLNTLLDRAKINKNTYTKSSEIADKFYSRFDDYAKIGSDSSLFDTAYDIGYAFTGIDYLSSSISVSDSNSSKPLRVMTGIHQTSLKENCRPYSSNMFFAPVYLQNYTDEKAPANIINVPMYNSPLGVFNLFNTPQIKLKRYVLDTTLIEFPRNKPIYSHSQDLYIELDELNYLVNKASAYKCSKFNSLEKDIEILASFIIEYEDNNTGEPPFKNDSFLISESDNQWRTEFIPIENLLNQPVKIFSTQGLIDVGYFNYGKMGKPIPKNVFLKLIVNFKKDIAGKTKNAILVKKYKCEIDPIEERIDNIIKDIPEKSQNLPAIRPFCDRNIIESFARDNSKNGYRSYSYRYSVYDINYKSIGKNKIIKSVYT